MMNCMMGMGMGMMMLLGLLLLSGVAAVILVVVWLARRTGSSEAKPERQGRSSSDALEILKLRYARGEIDTEQYTRMKRELAEE